MTKQPTEPLRVLVLTNQDRKEPLAMAGSSLFANYNINVRALYQASIVLVEHPEGWLVHKDRAGLFKGEVLSSDHPLVRWCRALQQDQDYILGYRGN